MPPRMTAPERPSAWPPHVEARAEAKPAPKVPANSNVQGVWENGVFRFNSPEAIEAWRRKAYSQGVSADNWHQGSEVDDKTRALAEANLGGPMPAMYQGPDGKYRFANFKTIEDKDVRDHRLQYIKGKTIDQIAADKMPGEDEYIAKGTVQVRQSLPTSVNDNQSPQIASQEQMKVSVPYGGRFAAMPDQVDEPKSGVERPNLFRRFDASSKRAFIDSTGAGAAIQQFKSGHARSPDILATRPPDRFLQSGSKGAVDWYRMYEPLGIAGGKRRIDFLSPDERKQWQTEWEALSADQQAAYRAMWEEKQKEYVPWRAQIDREINLPSPQSKAEYVVDFLGSLFGSMGSPENWIGIGPSAAANTVRAPAAGFAAEAAMITARNSDNLAGAFGEAAAESVGATALRKLDDLTERMGPNSPFHDEPGKGTIDALGESTFNFRAELEQAKKIHYTLRDAYNLPGPHLGLIYVKEKATGSAEWIAFMKGHPDVIWLEATQEFAVPAIRYVNPNPNGKNLIRLDAGGLFGDVDGAVLTDTKRQMAIWSKGSQSTTKATLGRLREALQQNPKYGKIIYEIETEAAAQKARLFIERNGFSDIIIIKVRGK